LEITDAELMNRVRGGSMEDLDLLFTRHHRRLYTFCYRLTGSRESAEDVVQDVFLRIIAYRRSFRPGSSFVMWALTIARNAAARRGRRESRLEQLADENEVPGESRDPIEVLEREIETERLERALASLDEDTRELLLLARFEGRSYADIARHFGVTEGAIKVRVFRALKRLRDGYMSLARRGNDGVS
jgi:RNA polymerase sigma factor (sigma-70 family)